jgi:hypothetical protein
MTRTDPQVKAGAGRTATEARNKKAGPNLPNPIRANLTAARYSESGYAASRTERRFFASMTGRMGKRSLLQHS